MKIPFSPPDITEAEIEQVAEALRSGWITTGPKTKELEREVAEFCGGMPKFTDGLCRNDTESFRNWRR